MQEAGGLQLEVIEHRQDSMTAFSPTTEAADRRALQSARRRRRWIAVFAMILVAVLIVTPVALYFRGTGIKTTILENVGYSNPDHPRVTAIRPAAADGMISCNAFFAVDVELPNTGHPIDPATVNSGSVRLIRRLDNTAVPARVNTSAAGDAIVLQPEQALDPNTVYRFEILPALKDTAGGSFQPFRASYTTGGGTEATSLPVAFEKVPLPQSAGRMYTAVTFSPDGALYAGTYDGYIFRYALNADGTVATATEIDVIRKAGDRLITGLCFDPSSTAETPVLYVSHGQSTRTSADEWTGTLTRLTGADLSQHQDVLVHLPRAARDHLNNQMAFGPDGALYLAIGSNSAMGDADPTWGNRPERKLSACVVRIDLAAIGQRTIDVRTNDADGPYDPAAPGAPVTLFATGVRNAYDVLFNRAGKMIAPINGSAAGGNAPESPDKRVPGLHNLRLTIPDHLAQIDPGSYHGHPNPSRGEYVLMGGNPTDAIDSIEVNRYPVGTPPHPRWQPPIAEFGSNLSPCGILEFRGVGRTAVLDGALMVCRFSGGKDICLFVPDAAGVYREMVTGLDGLFGFADPLDLAQHPTTGHLYVAEFGGKRLTLLRARPDGTSNRVYRQKVGQSMGLHETPSGKNTVPGPGDERED